MTQDDLFATVIIGLFIVIAFVFAILQHRKRMLLLSNQAEKRNGEVLPGNIFSWSKLLLKFKGETILIYSVPGGKNRPPKTIAQMKLDNERLPNITVARNNLWRKLQTSFGKERITTGDDEFDAKFFVTAEDSFMSEKFLSGEIKSSLLNFSKNGLTVKIKPAEITVSFPNIPNNDDEYDEFIELVYRVVQKLI